MSLIKGIHHACIKCETEQEYEKIVKFYGTVLEMPVKREWDGGIMFNTGSGLIEVFKNVDSITEQGVIRHFALATDDVDACVKAVREAGYEISVEPKDVFIAGNPNCPARIAFCKGPLGEEIEFFDEK